MNNKCILILRNFNDMTFDVYQDYPWFSTVMSFDEAQEIIDKFLSEEDNEYEFKIVPLDDEMFYSGFDVMKMPIFEVKK